MYIALLVVFPILVVGLVLLRVFRTIKIDDPVAGCIDINSASGPSNATYQNFSITGVMIIEGLPAQVINYSGMCKTAKHPFVGMHLPITASRSEPSKFRVEWDQVLTHKESALQGAQAQAAALNNASQQATHSR